MRRSARLSDRKRTQRSEAGDASADHTLPAYTRRMTFANVGTLGVRPGQRGKVVDILTRPNRQLEEAGCLLYEVGVSDEHPDTVFVAELWTSAEAHGSSLQLESVRAAIAEAMPFLSGQMEGKQFSVIGSPLRDP